MWVNGWMVPILSIQHCLLFFILLYFCKYCCIASNCIACIDEAEQDTNLWCHPDNDDCLNKSPVQKAAAHLCTETTLVTFMFPCFPHIFPVPLSYLSCKDCVVSCQCFVIKGEFIRYCFVPVLSCVGGRKKASIETPLHFHQPHFIN